MVIPQTSAALSLILWTTLAIAPLASRITLGPAPQGAIAQISEERESPLMSPEAPENIPGDGSDDAETTNADAATEPALESSANASTEAQPLSTPPLGGILYATSLAYGPDGLLIAATGDQGTVRLFDANGNPVGNPLDGLTGQLSTLAFSPDGRRIVGATDDGSIQVWDRQGNAIGNPFTGHESAITALVFHPNGESIATAGVNGTVRRWDLEGNELDDSFTGHEGAVNGIAFSPTGEAIASAGADGTVRLWSLGGDLLAPPFAGHEGAVNSVAFSPTGEAIASAGADGTVRLFDRQGNEQITPIVGHEGAVNAAVISPDGNTLLSAGTDGTLRLWGIDGQSIEPAIEAGQGTITAIAFHPDGTTFASGGTDGTFRLWHTNGTPTSDPISGYISSVTPARGKLPTWVWWALPLSLFALLLGWASSRRRTNAPQSNEVAVNTHEVSPHLMAALSSAASGKHGDALKQFNHAIQEEPNNTVALTARGNLLNEMERYHDALDSFNTALDIQADLPQALTGKALALTALGHVEDAVPTFDRALTANRQLPDFNWSPITAGGALLTSGAPLTAKALSGKGTALLATHRADEALAAFDEALTHDPQSVDAIAGRNRALMMIGHIGERKAPSASPPPSSSPSSTPSSPQATTPPSPQDAPNDQMAIAAKKFEVGQPPYPPEALAGVDRDLPDLPDGYGDSRIVLLPRDPQWAFAYWDVPNEQKEELRRQGGATHALRLYDVTSIDLNHQNPHSLQQYPCDELARTWYLPIPVSDRDYVVEIGYVTGDGSWLMLARSAPVHIPPTTPADWRSDQFLTVSWDDNLRGQPLASLTPLDPATRSESAIDDRMFDLAQSAESLRATGSLFGFSSYVFPSGMGQWSASGVGMMSGVGMSGVGFSASMPPMHPRKFWFVADAELIVYGATEPDATLYVGDRPVPLNPDGTFQIQISFQDGHIQYPIRAIAADGEQSRSIRMTFERQTPRCHTNPKDDAADEWF